MLAYGKIILDNHRKSSNTFNEHTHEVENRLPLHAEMKLPREAWLEFKVDKENQLTQTATFCHLGLLGRLYWFLALLLHR